ncbi:thioredoxin family protein [Hwanghaeella sp.]|uniref:thioredoxin family protein n=1 Tax=Hwanghaeella sp. TaxID=2605943 RepID=UPI003CCBDFDC
MYSRRQFLNMAGGAAVVIPAAVPLAGIAGRNAAAAELSEDGLHVQDWFVDSFLDLTEDHATAAAEGRHFAVIIEQRGCPYCRDTHEINFAHPKVREYIPANFDMLQLNLHGSRMVTDFDGEELEERELARKWLVNFTPTIVFFPIDAAAVEGKSGRDAEAARLPGYFRPFTFMQMFKFVHEEKFVDSTFQRYLAERVAEMDAQGLDPAAW